VPRRRAARAVNQEVVLSYPEDLRYTPEHEWARIEGGVVTVGVTSYATEQLGDVVFVELPEVGTKLETMKPFGVVEAVKTVSDLFAPLTGEVVEVNTALADNPALVNQAPFGEGWMIRIKPSDPAEIKKLLTSDDYTRLIEEQHA
jgi:glycine cleavage system H protein